MGTNGSTFESLASGCNYLPSDLSLSQMRASEGDSDFRRTRLEHLGWERWRFSNKNDFNFNQRMPRSDTLEDATPPESEKAPSMS